MKIEHIYLSPGHNYFGHFGQEPGRHAIVETAEVECVADKGLKGDRFFGYKENYKGQVTFFSFEVYEELCREMRVKEVPPSVFRRNLLVSGADLNALIGQKFHLQGIAFEGVEECRPCAWMDLAFAPGAEVRLRGRGGLRARVLSSGWLRSEPVECPRDLQASSYS